MSEPVPLPEKPPGGFVLSRTLKLVFEDEDLEGLEVRCRALSVEQLLQVTDLAALAEADTSAMTDEDKARIDTLFGLFAERLVSWNVTDDDGLPVPATLAGVRSQDFAQVIRIIMAWMTAASGVGEGLGKASTGGGLGPSSPGLTPLPPLGLDLPMEPLPSPAS